ncbi:S-layer homology domain-containing protein [Paenibacillus aurantius]|uniref:S-layer homology domain-containing protein n=1 Tax=Paenibacillus aurantius TaxID=2918900 RepID=A0AA96LA16_9BACL|nr:S-layer homology domain-containing protein [Paenibacillus aurantius]WNQ09786.1 S-layer homology domain-containing protein [Paenibacillus aurantius]
MKKAWTAAVLAVTIGLAGAATLTKAGEVKFLDVNGHWAKSGIEQAVQKGYVDGYEDGTFRPDRNVSRAEFLKQAVTALKLEVAGAGSGNDWYVPYVNAAVNAGIHRYEDFTTGDWNTAITREEMARIAVRASGEKTDDDKKWLYLAAQSGLIQGLAGGALGETEATTRAQSVTVIERILTVKGGGKLEVDKYAVANAELFWHKTNIFTVMPEFTQKQHPAHPWDPNNLFVATPDGKYRGELEALIAIDLADPNDPHLGELPELRWYNGLDKGFPIEDYKDSYLVWFKGRTVFNTDHEIYQDWKILPSTIIGYIGPDFQDFSEGNLNTIANVYHKKLGDFAGFIVPKKGLETMGFISFDIYSPSIVPNPNYSKSLLQVTVPEAM